MNKRIDAILFDMGGTLRSTTIPAGEVDIEKIRRMIALLDADVDELEFISLLEKRSGDYKDWSRKTLLELNEVELWKQWMLPDWPAGQVSRVALQLSQLWRDATGKHIVFPETRETVLALFRRGYRLGLVSNTASTTEVPQLLMEQGIAACFDAVILSSVVGIRKPDPAILLMAAERMAVNPERCAYIGDQPSKDVASAREAGFGLTVILHDPRRVASRLEKTTFIPDYSINNLSDLLVLFPARNRTTGKKLETDRPIYDASLSTMWAKKNFSLLDDFFLAAGRLGFSKVELNHQIDSEKLNQVDLDRYQVSSIHEPCPADISVETLKARDWMISSPDEECRQQGVASIKRSIELADRLSVRTLVVHCGHVSLDMVFEKKLRDLFHAGLVESADYLETKGLVLERRRNLIGSRLDAVMKSLKELLEFSGRFQVRLGLENRFHYFDIPTQDEMAVLLELAGADRLGFIFDVGHATAMDRLGFFPGELWLKRFGQRIYGTHLHDVIGVTDHHAPGLGDVDFKMLAKYLPKDSFRTLEVMSFNTPEQVRTGLKVLFEAGCVEMNGQGAEK